MGMNDLLWAGIKAFLITLVLTPIVRDVFRAYNVVDRPGRRKVHAYPIPRVGGIPIAVAYAISVLALFGPQSPPGFSTEALKVLPGAALIFLTGLLDDFINLRPVVKLMGQIAGALLVFANGLRIDVVAGVEAPLWLSFPLTIMWLLLATNALNLIDGLDGLCAGIGFLGSMSLFAAGLIHGNYALVYTTLPLAGALLGFLLFNFNPATVFLGDSGALTLGFLLGCFGIIWMEKASTSWGIALPLLVLSIPLLDVSLSILRRALKGHGIFAADRGHIHHRLLDHGLSAKKSALALYLMAAPGIAAALVISSGSAEAYHFFAVLAFCLIAICGVLRLRYPEFRIAGRLLLAGEFRRILAEKVRVEQAGNALAKTRTEEDWWRLVIEAARDSGWIRLVWSDGLKSREQRLSERPSSWVFTVALSPGESVRVEGDAAAGKAPVDLVTFSEILCRTFPANRGERQPALP